MLQPFWFLIIVWLLPGESGKPRAQNPHLAHCSGTCSCVMLWQTLQKCSMKHFTAQLKSHRKELQPPVTDQQPGGKCDFFLQKYTAEATSNSDPLTDRFRGEITAQGTQSRLVHKGLKERLIRLLGVLRIWTRPYSRFHIPRYTEEGARAPWRQPEGVWLGSHIPFLTHLSFPRWPPLRLSLCASLSLPPTYYPENYVSRQEWKAALCSASSTADCDWVAALQPLDTFNLLLKRLFFST